MTKIKDVIDEEKIFSILEKTKNSDAKKVLEILDKAKAKKGLSMVETGILLNTENPELIEKMFAVSGKIKNEIYGERLVFFAPLYLSSFCVNDCDYCGFHRRNLAPRKKFTLQEVQ